MCAGAACANLCADKCAIQVAFIKQEAVEKAREIQIKADEEFAIEKGKIVRQEAINIDAQYDKKKKQALVAHKM